uniref:ORF79 n=1 Tax=Cydia pomonella granulosis virus TaxID=28289 RepID=A0A5B8H9U6_GVCP|nr:ORF79 [Cydia pomonella granulovirus]
MIVTVILSAFLFVVILLFMVSQSSNYDDTLTLEGCTRVDPTNCQQYYDCFGILKSCSGENRYDETSASCQNYYLTDCGGRFNPELPSVLELCDPFWWGKSSNRRFADADCRRHHTCQDNRLTILSSTCYNANTLYSIETQECERADEVDCGSRFVP